jgi:hypothetical protein
LSIAVAAAGLLTLAAASPALAADLYVDGDSPMEDPDCLTPSQPCDTIAEAMSQAAFTPQTDVVHVGPSATAYPGILFQNARIDLIGNDYAGVGGGTAAVLDGGMEAGVFFAAGAFTREVRGFTIRGGDNPDANDDYSLEGILATQLTIAENVFDDDAAEIDAYVLAEGSPVVSDNTVTGASDLGADATRGIEVDLPVAPVITGNSVTGVERSIEIQASPPGINTVVVEDNVLEVLGDTFTPPAGIALANASGDIRRNLITANPAATGTFTSGIATQGDSPGTIHLSRNRILGMPYVGANFGAGDPVTLSGDVIASNEQGGLTLHRSTTVTNATIWNNGSMFGDVNLNEAAASVVLDSTIIGNNGVDFLNPASTCTASFSRGPATGSLCSFQTNAAPSFANVAANDLHLTPAGNAALIDQGNPAAPAEPLDIDGDPRVLDGFSDAVCVSRRDIGADEVAVTSDCDPPNAVFVKTPRKRSRRRRARFVFASDEPGSSFKCSLDRKPFVACKSPVRTRRLKPGRHTFRVRAIDSFGNRDPSPAKVRFRILRPRRS